MAQGNALAILGQTGANFAVYEHWRVGASIKLCLINASRVEQTGLD